MQLTTASYRASARHLLRQANFEFQQGDLRQASEKAWGAVAQITKAYAQNLTPPTYHRSHRSLKNIARNLAQITANRDLLMLFNAGRTPPHVNFCEDILSAAAVQAGIQDAADYVTLAEARLPAWP